VGFGYSMRREFIVGGFKGVEIVSRVSRIKGVFRGILRVLYDVCKRNSLPMS
jgi:hypothetical protein